jgi:metallo-beta-lactamase family protein
MKITFYGGVKSVTGSNFLLESEKVKILIDCGLIQEESICNEENLLPFSYKPDEIKAVLITHAHLDHVGRLPKLVNEGFRGYVYSTLPTKDLAYEIILDCQKVINDHCRQPEVAEIYSSKNINKLFSRWQTTDYHQKFKLDDLEIEFFDAGHILGSAFIRINNLVFSGDLGNQAEDLHNDLEPLPQVDYLILESTYGDRDHQNLFQREEIFEKILEKVIYEKRTLIIPAFALERSQEIIFTINKFITQKKIPEIKVFFDSPLAQKIASIYEKYPEYLNPKLRDVIAVKGIFGKENFKVIRNKDEEREIFLSSPPKIILASSGMLTGGRILGILKKYIEDRQTILLFVGYQAKGSLGRKILDGTKEISINGEKFLVLSQILSLFSFSAHRDQQGILDWLYPQRLNLKKVFLTHGDPESKQNLRSKIIDNLAIETIIPDLGTVIEI